MTLYQFKLLEQSEQLDLIAQQAVYLTERIDGNYTYKLYQLGMFYIEEEWHTKFNDKRSVVSFISEERLLPYLHAIDLSSLPVSLKRN